MKFRATADELARGKLVRPGWHPVEVFKVTEGMDKTENPAKLLTIEARVIAGNDEDKGAVLRTNFSEKAPAMIKNFHEAVTGSIFEPDKDYDYTERTLKGKRLMFYVERDSWRGRPTNQVADYKPLEGDFAPTGASTAGAVAGGGAPAQAGR